MNNNYQHEPEDVQEKIIDAIATDDAVANKESANTAEETNSSEDVLADNVATTTAETVDTPTLVEVEEGTSLDTAPAVEGDTFVDTASVVDESGTADTAPAVEEDTSNDATSVVKDDASVDTTIAVEEVPTADTAPVVDEDASFDTASVVDEDVTEGATPVVEEGSSDDATSVAEEGVTEDTAPVIDESGTADTPHVVDEGAFVDSPPVVKKDTSDDAALVIETIADNHPPKAKLTAIEQGLLALGIKAPYFIEVIDPSDGTIFNSGFFDNTQTLEAALNPYLEKFNIMIAINPILKSHFDQFGWKGFAEESYSSNRALPVSFVKESNALAIDFKSNKYPAVRLPDSFAEQLSGVIKDLRDIHKFPEPIILDYLYGCKLVYKIGFDPTKNATQVPNEFIKHFKKKHKLTDVQVCEDFDSITQMVELPGTPVIGCGCNNYKKGNIVKISMPDKKEFLTENGISAYISKQKYEANKALKKYLLNAKKSSSIKPDEWVDKRTESFSPYINPADNSVFVDIEDIHNRQIRPMCMETPAFIKHLELELFRDNGKKVKDASDIIYSKIDEVIMAARCSAPQEELHSRLVYENSCIFYDLMDKDGNIIAISKKGVRLLNTMEEEVRHYHFTKGKKMLAQAFPTDNKEKTLYELFRPFLNMDDDYAILVIITVMTWFAKGANYFLCITGNEGSGKTQLTRFIQELVDPSQSKAGALPKAKDALTSVLAAHYCICFDNLSTIPESFSNILCTASYGASQETRKLYTTDDVKTTDFHNVIIFTSIDDSLIEKADLMQRTITIKADTIEDNRASEKEIQAEFEEVRPVILYKMFDTLAKALAIMPDINPKDVKGFRMVDSARLGCAISRILFGSEQRYIDAFNRNKIESYFNIVENDIVTKSILEWLRKKEDQAVNENRLVFPLKLPQIGSEQFYNEIVELAKAHGEDITAKGKAPNATALTKKRKHFTVAFKELGVFFEDPTHTNKGNMLDIKITKSLYPFIAHHEAA